MNKNFMIFLFGTFLCRSKLDEFLHINMIFASPRSHLKEFYDSLKPENLIIFFVKSEITGPSSIKYHNEEELLNSAEDSERYNSEIILLDKVKINKYYIQNYSVRSELFFLNKTLIWIITITNISNLGNIFFKDTLKVC